MSASFIILASKKKAKPFGFAFFFIYISLSKKHLN